MSDRIATERICRTVDGSYVPDGHPEAAFLVVGIGGPLPADFTGFGQPADITVVATPAEVVESLVEGSDQADDEDDPGEPQPEPEAPVEKPKAAKKAK